MNAPRTITALLAFGLLELGLTSCTSTSTNPAGVITTQPVPGANNLQVVMTIPPSWYPMLEDRVDDAFVSHMAEIFRDQGYQGKLVDVRRPDQPNPNYPVLSVNLLDWRMGFTGDIQCDFGASLRTASAIRQLGVFNGIAFRWMQMPGRFGLADTFGEAADDALRQLYRSIAKTHLVNGFVRR